MNSYKDIKREIRDLWQTTDLDASYMAYKYGMSQQSIRTIVRGLKSPLKKRRSLSSFHRRLGLALIDKRHQSGYEKRKYAKKNNISHFRLADLEKGYYDFTISELIRFDLLEYARTLDSKLLNTS